VTKKTKALRKRSKNDKKPKTKSPTTEKLTTDKKTKNNSKDARLAKKEKKLVSPRIAKVKANTIKTIVGVNKTKPGKVSPKKVVKQAIEDAKYAAGIAAAMNLTNILPAMHMVHSSSAVPIAGAVHEVTNITVIADSQSSGVTRPANAVNQTVVHHEQYGKAGALKHKPKQHLKHKKLHAAKVNKHKKKQKKVDKNKKKIKQKLNARDGEDEDEHGHHHGEHHHHEHEHEHDEHDHHHHHHHEGHHHGFIHEWGHEHGGEDHEHEEEHEHKEHHDHDDHDHHHDHGHFMIHGGGGGFGKRSRVYNKPQIEQPEMAIVRSILNRKLSPNVYGPMAQVFGVQLSLYDTPYPDAGLL